MIILLHRTKTVGLVGIARPLCDGVLVRGSADDPRI